MITQTLSNRLVFILSLLGLLVSGFLLYEYSINGPVYCPVGGGCDIVRSSPYSQFLGISIPILGVAFYVGMAILSVIHTHQLPTKLIRKLQLLGATSGVGFGVYLTYLEAFVIGAFCFWCILSFIISLALLLSIILAFKCTNEDGN
ncbi:vitamin K epoxide reductase family protein [Candidatus Daviesbacteria bacterium]|nr:vitamin K epoxide reductase family protein [Candidatus Daviesbacteria bacterium]